MDGFFKLLYGIHFPPDVRDEFLYADLALSVAHSDLRRSLGLHLSATDATPLTRGACAAKLPPRLGNDLYRLSAKKGAYARTDDPEDACWSLGPDASIQRLDPKFEQLLGAFPWRNLCVSYFNRHEHVSIQKLEALKHELERLVIQGGRVGRQRVAVIDSRVILGAWA